MEDFASLVPRQDRNSTCKTRGAAMSIVSRAVVSDLSREGKEQRHTGRDGVNGKYCRRQRGNNAPHTSIFCLMTLTQLPHFSSVLTLPPLPLRLFSPPQPQQASSALLLFLRFIFFFSIGSFCPFFIFVVLVFYVNFC